MMRKFLPDSFYFLRVFQRKKMEEERWFSRERKILKANKGGLDLSNCKLFWFKLRV